MIRRARPWFRSLMTWSSSTSDSACSRSRCVNEPIAVAIMPLAWFPITVKSSSSSGVSGCWTKSWLSLAMLTHWSPIRSRFWFTWITASTKRRSTATGDWRASSDSTPCSTWRYTRSTPSSPAITCVGGVWIRGDQRLEGAVERALAQARLLVEEGPELRRAPGRTSRVACGQRTGPETPGNSAISTCSPSVYRRVTPSTEGPHAQSTHRDDDNGEVTHERQESWFDCARGGGGRRGLGLRVERSARRRSRQPGGGGTTKVSKVLVGAGSTFVPRSCRSGRPTT